jgi:phage protein D
MADQQERERVAPSFEVYSNGSRIPSEAELDIFQIEVTQDLNGLGTFTLSLNAGDAQQGDIKWADSEIFREGSEIKIKAGFHGPLPDVFVGEVTGLEPEFPSRGPILLAVRGFDRMFRLGFARKTRAFNRMKDSDIASQIAGDWNLTPDVEATRVTHEYLFQNNETDLEFLFQRARHVGYEVKVESKRLVFRKPQEMGSTIATLTYGESLLSFFPRLSLLTQVNEVVVRSWQPKDRTTVHASAGSGEIRSAMGGQTTGVTLVERTLGKKASRVVVGESAQTPDEAEDLAGSMLNELAFEYIVGEGTCMGAPEIRPGTVLELKGLGRRFSGPYYVRSVTHSLLAQKGYVTGFTVNRSAA